VLLLDKEKYQTDFKADYFRKNVGLPENKFYLVYTGNVDVPGMAIVMEWRT